MRTYVEVKNRKEGEIIRAGLEDPMMRSMVKVFGAMKGLDKPAQLRIMRYVADFYGIKI